MKIWKGATFSSNFMIYGSVKIYDHKFSVINVQPPLIVKQERSLRRFRAQRF